VARPAAAAVTVQAEWAAQPVAVRVAVIRRLRHRVAGQAAALAEAAARPGASAADILVSEALPLLAACRFLERRAAGVLSDRAAGWRGRPLWLLGTRLLVRRVPFGVVLVIGPGNYPLLLPGVQALQALVAGNAVLLKPAPGGAPAMAALAAMLEAAGLPPTLFTVLDDSPEAARHAIAAGVDRVVLTGSAATGRAVLAQLAPLLVPATMELSGRDPLVVLPGADLDLAARAIVFGLTLNAGRTCIAPRRVIVTAADRAALVGHLSPLLAAAAALPASAALLDRGRAVLAQAGQPALGRADLLRDSAMAPLLVEAGADEPWVHEDLFLPLAALVVVADATAALATANAGGYALGASVFGPAAEAAAFARSLRAGCVVVNDVIVPTADPRLPFGGSGDSGFGVTRGAEGLLELTRPQAIVARTRRSTRHLTTLPASSAALVAKLLRLAYGDAAGRLGAIQSLLPRRKG